MFKRTIVEVAFAEGRPPAHEHITQVKLIGGTWQSVAQVIESLRSGWYSYQTLNQRTSQTAKVVIYKGEFIRTTANDEWSDNLLDLPKG